MMRRCGSHDDDDGALVSGAMFPLIFNLFNEAKNAAAEVDCLGLAPN